METIRDITGEVIKVDNLAAAIRQCRACMNSSYIMPSGHTVGENHAYMLQQLLAIRERRRRRSSR